MQVKPVANKARITSNRVKSKKRLLMRHARRQRQVNAQDGQLNCLQFSDHLAVSLRLYRVTVWFENNVTSASECRQNGN